MRLSQVQFFTCDAQGPSSQYSSAMERIFGLPAHPLIVHFPVVAIPLMALAVIALIARPRWLDTVGPGVALFSVATAIATFLATSSGAALSELLDAGERIDVHRTLGEQLRLIVLVQAVTIVAIVTNNVTDFFQRDHPLHRVVSGLALVTSIVAVIWTIRTGHSGAEQSWGFLS